MQGRFGRILAVAGIAGALLFAAADALAAEPLSFFKNYFVTGDYVVRGVSLWRKGDANTGGKAVGRIPPLGGVGGMPAQADILAAFLYVQTAETVQGSGIDHATFNGVDLGPFTATGGDPGSGTFMLPLVDWATAPAPCWDVTFPGGRKVMTYRADVLRFLPIDPRTGKHDLGVAHWIAVPDAGRALPDISEGGKETKWSSAPRAIGASLVVVYRDPTKPFSSVVIYDGAYRKAGTSVMNQTILGFYQAAVKPGATMTHIVGDGSATLGEQVLFDDSPISTNPYTGADGPKWDDPRFSVPLLPNASSARITVKPAGKSADCLTFSAIVLETAVQDTDGDALVDVWERSNPPPLDPTGTPLPNLSAMGASPVRKDLFVEIGYMRAAAGTQYGGAAKPEHSHLPAPEALKKVAEAFAAAPVENPDGSTGISVHFDVGGAYDALYAAGSWPSHLVHGDLARGGESISETRACQDSTAADPSTAKPVECATFAEDGHVVAQADMPGQYPKYPGTVGWKTGFQLLRDELLGFDRNRKDIFHYVLFAHSIGMPREDCLKDDGSPDLKCQDEDPEFRVPRTNSGIADFPGGDVLVTLGAFNDAGGLPIGTTYMQASTLMHELGHNFELTHAGLQSLDPAVPREPNCKPLYLSVMNYLYQLRGLPDASGKLQLDYSSSITGNLDELVSEAAPLVVPYRIGWYAPWERSYVKTLAEPAKKHCNGSDLLDGEAAMVRVDAPGVSVPIDWNADGSMQQDASSAYNLDINFDGALEFPPTPVVPTSGDWQSLRFGQLGGRRSPGGFYVDAQNNIKLGPLSLDIGRGDIGRGDIGRGDIGRGDIGRGDIGRGDIGRGDIGTAVGRGDIGRGDIGRGDIGRGDIGRGDIGRGDIGIGSVDVGRGDIGRGVFGLGDLDLGGHDEPLFELDLETVIAVSGGALPPPNELGTCLTMNGECVTSGGDRPVRLAWNAPNVGVVRAYLLYRFKVQPGATFPPGAAELPAAEFATLSGDALATTYLDAAPDVGLIAYFVRAQFDDGSFSGISNFATIVTPAIRPALTLSATPPGQTTYGQPVTFTVSGISGAATPGGTLQIFDGTTIIQTCTGSAVASCAATTSGLAAGTHSITAVYSGDATYTATTSPVFTHVVAPGLTLTEAPGSPTSYGAAVTLTASLTGIPGTTAPGGSLQILDGATPIRTCTGSEMVSCTVVTQTLAASVHTFTATYSGDGTYASASASPALSHVVIQAPLTVVANDKTIVFGAPAPTFDATVTGLVSGDTLAPTCSAGTPTPTAVGRYTITCDVTAPNYVVTSQDGWFTITPAAPTATQTAFLNVSANPSYAYAPVTFTFEITSVLTATAPSGTLSFSDGGKPLAAQPVTGCRQIVTFMPGAWSCSVPFATSALGYGSHSIVASYSGDANFASSRSDPYVLTLLVATPSMTSSALAVAPGGALYSAGVNSVQYLGIQLGIENVDEAGSLWHTNAGGLNVRAVSADDTSACVTGSSSSWEAFVECLASGTGAVTWRWERTADATTYQIYSEDVVAVGDGSAYAIGAEYRGTPGAGVTAATLWRLDATGNLLWSKVLGTDPGTAPPARDSYGLGVALGTGGEIYAVSQGEPADGYPTDVWVWRLPPNADASSVAEQIATFGTTAADHAEKITVEGDSIYVFGFTEGTFPGETQSAAGAYDLFVAKIPVAGALSPTWVRQFGSGGLPLSWTANGFSMAPDRAGGVYVMWETSEANGTVHRSWVRRYTPYGSAMWEKEVVIGGPLSVGAIATNVAGDAYVSGTTGDGKGVIARIDPATGALSVLVVPKVDQQQLTYRLDGVYPIGGSGRQEVAQIVTPAFSGVLTAVRMPIGCDSGSVLELSIEGVTDGKPDGTVLYGPTTFSATELPALTRAEADPFRTLALPDPPSQAAAVPIAIVLRSAGTCGIYQGAVVDAYAGGQGVANNLANPTGWMALLGDLPFQTFAY